MYNTHNNAVRDIFERNQNNIAYLSDIYDRYGIVTEIKKENINSNLDVVENYNNNEETNEEINEKTNKDFQKKSMKLLENTITNKSHIKYVKANTIANKAVAIKFGLKKSIKKENMTEEMLSFRDIIMEKITALMIAQDMGVVKHVSKIVYDSIKQDSLN